MLGAQLCGKTSLIEQCINGVYIVGMTFPTVEDTYEAWIEVEKGQRERIRIYDTAGLVWAAKASDLDSFVSQSRFDTYAGMSFLIVHSSFEDAMENVA